MEAFSDSAAFLFQYPGSYPFDLIFLDIDLGGMDGMALARKIRETDSEVPILFLTNHKEYVFEGYEVQAFRYLLKPVTEDTLFPLLEELQAMRAHRSYLVNLAHVERITRTECLLSDGTKIPVSRGCYASLNHAFLQFYRPNAF